MDLRREACLEPAHELQDVVHLELRDLDQGEVADGAVRAVEHEQVGELGYRDGQIGSGAVGPGLFEGSSVEAGDDGGPHESVDLEPGCEDDDVELVKASGVGSDAATFDARDGRGDEFGVGFLDRVVEVGRHDEPFAGGAVVGLQAAAQFRVGDVLVQVRPTGVLDLFETLGLRVDNGIGEVLRDCPQ